MKSLTRLLLLCAAIIASAPAFAGSSTIAVTPGSGATYAVGTNGSSQNFGYFGICDFAACAQGVSVNAAGTAGVNGLAVQGLTGGVALPVAGAYYFNVTSSTMTRAANVVAYAPTTGMTVCASTSVTCTPLTLSVANTNAGKGLITEVRLLKSGSGVTNATFNIYFFSAAPALTTPSQYDAVAYAGPRAADIPNFIGWAVCSTPIPTSDTTAQTWYECPIQAANGGGVMTFQALSGSTNLDALITVTGNYTPTSAETFNVYASGSY
jgi:hypothetical protein